MYFIHFKLQLSQFKYDNLNTISYYLQLITYKNKVDYIHANTDYIHFV